MLRQEQPERQRTSIADAAQVLRYRLPLQAAPLCLPSNMHPKRHPPVSPMLPRSFIIRWNSLEGMLTWQGGKRGEGGGTGEERGRWRLHRGAVLC